MNAAVVRAKIESALGDRFPRALTVAPVLPPTTVPIGLAAFDTLTGGLPRGAMTEIAGPASSGRTGILQRALAAVSRAGEFCALVDTTDSFDPASAESAGVCLQRVLWIRCSEIPGSGTVPKSGSKKRTLGRVEQALRATDLVLQSGGFGLVVLDLGSVPQESARRIPLTTWFRFRRAVEKTPSIFLALESEANAKTCASLVLQMRPEDASFRATVQTPGRSNPTYGQLFQALHIEAGLARSPFAKKPAQSAHLVARAVHQCG